MTPTRRAEWLAAYNAAPPYPCKIPDVIPTSDVPLFEQCQRCVIEWRTWWADAALAAADERFPPAEPCPSCGNVGDHATFCKAAPDELRVKMMEQCTKALLSIVTMKDIRPPMQSGTAERLEEECRFALNLPRPPWPEAGSSLPEGVGESVVHDDPIRVTLDPRFYLGVPSVRALVEAAREAESFLTHIGSITGERGEVKEAYALRDALARFSEPAPKAELPEPVNGDYLIDGQIIRKSMRGDGWVACDGNRNPAFRDANGLSKAFPTAQAALDALVAEGLVTP